MARITRKNAASAAPKAPEVINAELLDGQWYWVKFKNNEDYEDYDYDEDIPAGTPIPMRWIAKDAGFTTSASSTYPNYGIANVKVGPQIEKPGPTTPFFESVAESIVKFKVAR